MGFKGISKKFKGCFEEVSMVIRGKLKGALGDLGDSREFQGNLKEVQTVFQGSFKGVKSVPGKFP